ncbi:hypothetical protein Y032_0040g296 [Ancylostoma ceylanicum]|uniref:Secreted protein n=1 Tax=Ancylostoma ceylanicum TaxID=53326 RepID=A0A016UHH3_9BILA|nr:hypothetical protein Y032_0040g296 [Ancylostoma ceylanicum]
MKAIVGLLLVSFSATTQGRTASFLHCDSNFFCSKNPRQAWKLPSEHLEGSVSPDVRFQVISRTWTSSTR